MNTPTLRCASLAVLAALGGLLPGVPGCASARHGAAKPGPAATAGKPVITLDGQFNDWPEHVGAIADADWVYFHATVEGAVAPLQAAPETLALWLDADADVKTGATMPIPAAAGNGVDLVVEFSPQDPQHPGQTKSGVAAFALGAQGAAIPLGSGQIGLAAAPTFASTAYEIRISRHIDSAAAPALAGALQSRGRARVLFVLKDGSGKIVGWSDPETFSKPAASPVAPKTDRGIPAKPAGSIRIVSYNVLKSKLASEPNTFARLFQVLDADVILAQEWNADAATATAWFTAIVTGAHAWNARAAAGDVVIVSPFPIDPLGPDALTLDSGSGGGEKEPAVRFVAGLVKTPAGLIAVGTAHLKCCGTAGSVEDKTRIAQAAAINRAMKAALDSAKPALRVFAGDFNLVGTRAPLETLRAGLDTDGSDLAVADPQRFGDAAYYTWADARTEFPPGRLDFALYSDASAQVVQSFVVDTSLFSTKALARMGLDAGDTGASDHLPVVVDLKPR